MGATTARGKRISVAGLCLAGLASALLVAGCRGGGSKAISQAAAPGTGTSGSSSAPSASASASPSPSASTSASTLPPATTASTGPATTAPTTASSSPKPAATTPPATTPSSSPASWASSLPLAFYYPDNGQTVGVGMPVRVQFGSAVSPADRAAVERAMRVTTTPHVDGAWSWLNSTTVDFRPQGFWPAHTHVAVHLGLADVKTPDGTHGTAVRDFSFTVGDDHETVVDAATHRMTVTTNGQVVRTMPTGTGKPGYDTDSGTMAVLAKIPVLNMTSCGIGLSCTPGVGDYYDLTVHNDVQLTNQGVFVHQAEWDSQIGSANVSHGCIHLNPADASWFYGFAQIGDPVTVTNTPHTVKPTNGYGDYTLSWSAWLAGSAAGVQAG
jgi:lipoprotein-anchoring transpeptidase ErfK/SrfK